MKTRQRLNKTIGLTVVGLLLASAGPAHAAAINFVVGPSPGGFLSYFGNPGDPLLGAGLSVAFVGGTDTPLNSGVGLVCVSCTLNFTTGPFIGGNPLGWAFAGGGVLAIQGGVDMTGDLDADDPTDIPVGTNLLVGTFVNVPFTIDFDPTSDIINGITFSTLIDIHDPRIPLNYGMPLGVYVGTMVLSAAGFGNPPGPFVAQVNAGFVTSSPIPEPTTVVLLGVGVLGLVVLGRRRGKKQ